MGSLKRAGDILPLILMFNDCIAKKTEKSGEIRIPQELLNVTLKKIILSKWNNISDFKCDFYSGEITIIKKVLLMSLSLRLHRINFIINKHEYKFTAKHNYSNLLFFFKCIGVLPTS